MYLVCYPGQLEQKGYMLHVGYNASINNNNVNSKPTMAGHKSNRIIICKLFYNRNISTLQIFL